MKRQNNEDLLKDGIRKALNVLGRPVMSYEARIAMGEYDKKIAEASTILVGSLTDTFIPQGKDEFKNPQIEPISSWEIVLIIAIIGLVCLIVI